MGTQGYQQFKLFKFPIELIFQENNGNVFKTLTNQKQAHLKLAIS